jgi:CubicO group peptidase (beta-lactamase class C family)
MNGKLRKGAKMNKQRIRLVLAAALSACLLVLAVVFLSRAKSLSSEANFPAVDTYIEAQMETLNIPGLALAVVQGDQVSYARVPCPNSLCQFLC